MRLRIVVIMICAVVMMAGSGYSQTNKQCMLAHSAMAWKNYDDIKKHVLTIMNGESDTPIITEGMRDRKIVDAHGPVTIIEEMNFMGMNIWMFRDWSGTILYSWARLGFKCEIVKTEAEKATELKEKAAELNWQFLNSAYEGKLEDVKRFLKEGADINARNSIGQTALLLALMYHHSEVVNFLKEHGAETDPGFGKRKRINDDLIYAACHGSLEEVKRSLDAGANINAKDNSGHTSLIGASCRGRLEIAKLLLDKGADVNAWGGPYGTALIAASVGGSYEAVKLLIDRGADINKKNSDGDTALKLATKEGHLEVVKILKSHGAKN